jgi:phage anti-repressor protein
VALLALNLSDGLGPSVENVMNVGELKKMLEKYPDDMEILNDRCSDYDLVEEEDWTVVEAVQQGNSYVMRSHPTMSEDNKARAKKYLHLLSY